MKIRKVAETPMDIHAKEAPKIHVQNKANVKTNKTKIHKKSERSFISKRREKSDASIKLRNKSLHAAGMVGNAALSQMDGSEEIKESMMLAGMMAIPAVGAAKKGKKLLVKRKRQQSERIKQVQSGEKIKRREVEHEKSTSAQNEQRKAAKNSDSKKKDKSGKSKGKKSSSQVKSRMLTAFLGKLGAEQSQQEASNQTAKQMAKQAAAELVRKILVAVAPFLLIAFAIIALCAIVVVAVLAVIYNSPLAIFFPQPNTGYDSPRTVLSEYYKDFNAEISDLEDKGYTITYQNEDNGVAESNYNDTLMVYMVLYGTGNAGYVMDEDGNANLKEVFDMMNYYDSTSTEKKIIAGESLGKLVSTGYCNCEICCGKNAGGNTASGKKPKAKHTIAVDKNNPEVPMGTKVIINGITYTVEDTGDFDKYGVSFDIYFDKHEQAQDYGRKTYKCYLAEGAKNEKVNDVTIKTKDTLVHNLTYNDLIDTGELTDDEVKLLKDMMKDSNWNSSSTGSVGTIVASLAASKVGCSYDQNRRMEEGYYDCSSLVYRLYKEAGIELPGIAADQGKYCYQKAMIINKKDLKPGDLIFYSYEENGRFRNISHVAIYVGDDRMIHAANKNRGVVEDPLRTSSVVFYARPY